MPCKTTSRKKKKPPKAWFDETYAEVKAGNPGYSDEQVRATVGAMWYENLSPKQKAKAKSMQFEQTLSTIGEVCGKLEKGIAGWVKPSHKYTGRKPKKGGKGFVYRYAEHIKEAFLGPEKKENDLLAPSTKPPEYEGGNIVEVYNPKTKKWEKAEIKAALPSPRAGILHGSGGPADYDYFVNLLSDGKRIVTPFLMRPVAEKATKGMAQIDDFHDLRTFGHEYGIVIGLEGNMDGLMMLKQITSDFEKGKLGTVRAGHKYFKRVPKAGGGYTYYYTKEDWLAKVGHEGPSAPEKAPTKAPKSADIEHFGKAKDEYWEVPSKSKPDKEPYKVQWHKYGGKRVLSCPCPIWVFNRRGNRTCSHTDAVKEELGKDYKKHEEAANMDIQKSEETLEALIEMDPLRAANEGSTGLDMVKSVADELQKALPPAPGKEETLGEHEIPHAKKTPPKEYAKEGAKSAEDYGDPKNFKYPIHTEGNARNAMGRLAQNKGTYTPEQLKSVAGKIAKACKKYGIDVSDEWKESMGLKTNKTEKFKKALWAQALGVVGSGKNAELEEENMTGLDMLKSVNDKLAKPIVKSVEAGPRGIGFNVKGEKIQAGITGKVAELTQKLTKMVARHPNCKIDDEEEDYPKAVGEGDSGTTMDINATAQCPNKEEHWRIRNLKDKIDRLQRIGRNLDAKKTFRLGEWDLQQYGL